MKISKKLLPSSLFASILVVAALPATLFSCAPNKGGEKGVPVVGFSFTGKVVELANPGNAVTNATYSIKSLADAEISNLPLDANGKFSTTIDATKTPYRFSIVPKDNTQYVPVVYDYLGRLASTISAYEYVFKMPTPAALTEPIISIYLRKKDSPYTPAPVTTIRLRDLSDGTSIYNTNSNQMTNKRVKISSDYRIIVNSVNYDIKTPNISTKYSYQIVLFI